MVVLAQCSTTSTYYQLAWGNDCITAWKMLCPNGYWIIKPTFNLIAFQVCWWFMLFQLLIYSFCSYVFVHIHPMNSFSSGRVVYKSLLSIWQIFYFSTGHTAPTPPSPAYTPALRVRSAHPGDWSLRSPDPFLLEHIPGPRVLEFPAQMAPSPFPEPGWVSPLACLLRTGTRGDQRLTSTDRWACGTGCAPGHVGRVWGGSAVLGSE